MNELTDCEIETLCEDGGFVVSRVKRAVGLSPRLLVTPVSEGPPPASLARLEQAFALREELDAAWATLPVELVKYEGKPALLLHDSGGESLHGLLGRPLAMGHGLRIAIGIANALTHLHARELIHRDLKPGNVLVKPATGEAWLTGFGLTSRLPRHRSSPDPPEVLAGTLAYMAPEQTGRMNRSVDSRSDLYSLGVTLYEIFAGELPFTASDPMEWVHCHIARLPPAPNAKVPEIPEPISAIIMKLMAKAPEERYHTAAGVEADLRRCLAALESHGRIDPFPTGAHDVPDRLLIPEKLYGREREIEALLAAFDRVVNNGRAELVLVSGYSGVGKSSVVNELHKALVPPRALFASGKFDQYKRDIPYATLAQAFEKLVSQILTQSEPEVGRWRDSLMDALGANGQLIINLIPKLEIIIGAQPSVADLPPQDTKSRFQRVLRRFIGVFARSEHPLALFLDDLQWLDAATIELVEHLLAESDVRHLLIVGAYRDNEVGPAHPLMQMLAAMKEAKASIAQIVLKPLAREDLEKLIADSIHAERDEARELVALVFEKTGGNPFFAIQFLMALAEESLLHFDASTAAWTWEIEHIRAKGFTDNVADLMAAKLDRLPEATKNALGRLACLGNVAKIGTMTLVHGVAVEEVHADLWEAVRAGFLFRSENDYTFLHDRVQEAAYALIPDDERATVHLRIGRVLMASLPPAEIEESIFDIVSQFDRGMALIASPAEREQVAELNLKAAKRAKAATAYASALTYLAAGRAMQRDECWEDQYRLTFELELCQAECQFVTGASAAAEQRLLALSERASTIVDRAAVTRMRMALYTTLDRGGRAVEVSLEYLREVGVNLSHQPDEQDIQREYERLWQLLGNRSIEELIDLPLMEDLNWWATLDVLVELVPTAMVVAYHRLVDLTLLRMANLALQHGNCDGSAYAFASLNVVLGFRYGDYQAGLRFGELGCALVERRGLDRFKIRAFANFGIFTVPWTKSMPIGRAMIVRGFDAAQATGDVTYAIYCSNSLVAHSLISGEPLDKVYREAQRSRAFAEKAGFGLFVNMAIGEMRLIQDLRGYPDDEVFLEDTNRTGGSFEQALDDAGQPMGFVSFICWVRKMQRCFFAGDYAVGLEVAAKASHRLGAAPYVLHVGDYHFYAALTRAAVFDSASEDERLLHAEALSVHYRQIETWAKTCSENFGSRAALIGAEIARIQGRDLDAQRLYEAAIMSAKANGFIQKEALASEVAARFYEIRGLSFISEAYLRKAHSAYLQWGAHGKARRMEQRHPALRPSPQSLPSNGTSVGQFDFATIVKVSRVLSGEIVLERLIEKLLGIAIEHAGAVRGLLLLPHGGELQVAAEATTRHDEVAVLLREAPATSEELPESVLRYVARSQEHVLLDDALTPNSYSADEYFQRKRSRSVLCLPLVRQSRIAGILYLENDLASHVFTPPRIDMLQLLAAQAAISLENSRLYSDLQRAEENARISARELRLAIDTIPALAWNSRPDGSNESFSKQWHDYTGISPEDALSGGWKAAYHPDDVQKVVGKWTEMLAAGIAGGVEARIRRFDGEYRTFLVRGVPLRDESGAITKWYGTCTEIEDLKRAEMELRRSKVYLDNAEKLNRTGAVGLRVSDGKILWSEEAARIYGYDPGTEATAERILQRVHPDDVAFLTNVLSRAAQGGASFDFQHRLLMPDGTVKYLRSLAHPVKDETGLEEILGAITDIT
ncbi:MAG: AAA family ATPase, partial [Chthoniobacteraceae bacterium]